MKICTCGISPRSGSRNAWTRSQNINGASRLSNFWNFSARSKWFPVAIGDHGQNLVISLWPETSNNQWSGGIAAHPALPPKIPSAKIRWKSSRLDFLGSRRHPRRWLSSKGPNYQSGVLIISAGAIEGHFEGKTPREVHRGGLVLARKCPDSPGTCDPEDIGLPGLPVSLSPTLFSGSAPSEYYLFPGLKKQLKVRHFSSDAEVIAAAETWLDGQPSDFFLSGSQKLE